jgi:hypothetical protein
MNHNMIQTCRLPWVHPHRDAMYVTQTMLNLINSRLMNIADREMVNASREITEILQKVYFYSVDKLGFDLHPRIKAALTEK